MTKLAAVRGMPIISPPAGDKRRVLENRLISVVHGLGYKEMRPPVMEKTELFRRSVGEQTDIVEKEMYEFADKKGQSVCLRPEATAGLMRAGIDLGLFSQPQKIWFLGPMFRYERPQSGRLRQFDQLDVEAVGYAGAATDAEVIWLSHLLWQELGLTLELQLNALGGAETRQAYAAELQKYLKSREDKLDADSQRRLGTAPLRILDSKDPQTQKLLEDAPMIHNFWDAETKQHFAETCSYLDALGIKYKVNYKLVRGLDYYDKMVFEWVSSDLGAQNTLCAGGRYDGLIRQLGGKETPAVGFALGMERLLLLLENQSLPEGEARQGTQVIILPLNTETESLNKEAFSLLAKLRSELPGLIIECDFLARALKKKLKDVARQEIPYAVILGADEVQKQEAILRDMQSSEQKTLPLADLAGELAKRVKVI